MIDAYLQSTLIDFLRRFIDTTTSYICCIRPSSPSSSSSSRYDPMFVQKQVRKKLVLKPTQDILKWFSSVHWCNPILHQFEQFEGLGLKDVIYNFKIIHQMIITIQDFVEK